MLNDYDLKYEDSVIDYFDAKAAEYDLVDEQLYWRLSDRILWEVMKADVLSKMKPDFRFLDAGGGTGRWTCRMLKEFPEARGVIYDLSRSMTDQAQASAERLGVGDRLTIVNGRLEEVTGAVDGAFDLIFNFHNVLGFVQGPEAVIGRLSSLLEEDGLLVSMVPNSYHAAFFNIALGRFDEARSCVIEDRGRFTDTMPAMNLFTPGGLAAMYERGGLGIERLTGFPCLLYPGYQETQLHGSTASLQNMLASDDAFEAIVELELNAQRAPDIAARGNNLFLIGRKSAQR
jgi:ubiquinone/menaquinone biosynthesis C-methylase UbiE